MMLLLNKTQKNPYWNFAFSLGDFFKNIHILRIIQNYKNNSRSEKVIIGAMVYCEKAKYVCIALQESEVIPEKLL